KAVAERLKLSSRQRLFVTFRESALGSVRRVLARLLVLRVFLRAAVAAGLLVGLALLGVGLLLAMAAAVLVLLLVLFLVLLGGAAGLLVTRLLVLFPAAVFLVLLLLAAFAGVFGLGDDCG